MKIINRPLNIALAKVSLDYGKGYIAGPVRIAGGIAQTCLNSIAAAFTALPSSLGYIKKDQTLHFIRLIDDAEIGLLHIFRGCLEFLTGTSQYLDRDPEGRIMYFNSDHPFDGEMIF